MIAQDDPLIRAVLRADYLRIHDELDAAENELLVHSDMPDALHGLVLIALQRDDPEAALVRADALIALAPKGHHRLLHAEVLRQAGRVDQALEALVAIGKDHANSPGQRTAAFQRAADLAQRRRDYAALEALSDVWLAESAGDDGAVWTRALALARLARHHDALELFNAGRLRVVTSDQAVLVSEILYRAATVEVAVREIAGFSDQFGRQDERLEFLVLLAALRRDAELPDDLGDRVREGFVSFPEKFPNSQLMWAVEAPTTPEELEAFAERFVAPGAEAIAEVSEQVTAGRAPIAILAVAAGRRVSETWAGITPSSTARWVVGPLCNQEY